MPKIILGDNPFFAISHLSSEKSTEYLEDGQRFSNASQIIRQISDLGINLMMISSHHETKDLLLLAGYPQRENLPDICLVVPNVHNLNQVAAEKGLEKAMPIKFSISKIIKNLNVIKLIRNILVKDIDHSQVKYVALHNVVVDMLIGLRATVVLRLFAIACRLTGYKPVFLTLNPVKLLSLNIKAEAICTYYNANGYNVCDTPSDIFTSFENQYSVKEIWAMGIVASGVISVDQLTADKNLKRFTSVLVASSKLERIKKISQAIKNA